MKKTLHQICLDIQNKHHKEMWKLGQTMVRELAVAFKQNGIPIATNEHQPTGEWQLGNLALAELASLEFPLVSEQTIITMKECLKNRKKEENKK
jgi:hypothetical protein